MVLILHMEPCQFHTTDQHLQGIKVSIFECNFPDQHDQGPTGCGKSSNLKHVVKSPGIC